MAHEELIKDGKKAIKSSYKPEEVEDYFRKKGMDRKEAKQAINQLKADEIVEASKKAKKEQKEIPAQSFTQNKSSAWLWIILILIIAAIAYFFYSGILNFDFLKIK